MTFASTACRTETCQRYGRHLATWTSLSFLCGSLEMLVLIGISTFAPVRDLMLSLG